MLQWTTVNTVETNEKNGNGQQRNITSQQEMESIKKEQIESMKKRDFRI